MRRRLVRTLLAIATMTVVWLIVFPRTAQAMPQSGAPLCDPRGAITFAPPPQIQDAEISLDVPADCFEVTFDLRDVHNVDHGRSAPPQLSSSQEPLAGGAGLRFDLEFSERLLVEVVVETAPPAGVAISLERPPRS